MRVTMGLHLEKAVLLLFGFLFFEARLASQENEEKSNLQIIPMASYSYINADKQAAHIPGIGFGVTSGDYGKGFTDIHNSFFGLGVYQPVFFSGAQKNEVYHQIDILLDGRIERHQILGIFRSASDKPVSGGLHTFQAGAGWGYEVIRNSPVSFILGLAAAAGDFGFQSPVIPLPLLRFGLDTTWLNLRFDFLTGPNLTLTVAPEKHLRFTADIRMDYYRGIEDILGDCILWYRFFDKNSASGDFAGIGVGIKNDSLGFDLSPEGDLKKDRKYEMQYSAVFGVVDLTVLKIESGYILDSRILADEQKANSQGKGFYITVQGMYQF